MVETWHKNVKEKENVIYAQQILYIYTTGPVLIKEKKTIFLIHLGSNDLLI